MKKIITCLCLSIFICISIFKPIQIYALQPSDQYVNGPITDEEYQDLITAGSLASILASGAEIVVPETGIADLLIDIYNYAVDSEIGNAIWEYCTNPEGLKRDANTIRYYFKGQPNYLEDQGNLGLSVLLGTLGEDFMNQYEVPDIIETDPEPNYLPYIELINGSSNNYQYQQADFFFDDAFDYLNSGSIKLQDNCKNHSFIKYDNYPTIDKFNSSNQTNYYISYFASNKYQTRTMCATTNILNVTINGSGQSFSFLIQPNNIFPLWKYNTQDRYSGTVNYNTTNSTWGIAVGSLNSAPTLSSFGYTGTLEDCFKMLSMYCRNVNIYVNGVPWSLVSTPPDPIKIGGNTYISNTNTPVNYGYPNGSWFDPAYLLHLLENIDFNTQHTLSWVDIAPAFFDDNDQMALYTILIHRNDYDNLILEQYGSNRLTQNKGLLFPKNELQQYTETSTFITQSSISLIPDDILLFLGGCGILILIAYLINRLLE